MAKVREAENPFAKFKKTEVEAWLANPVTEEVVRELEAEAEYLRFRAVNLCKSAVDGDVQAAAVSIGRAILAIEAVKFVFEKAELRLSRNDEVPHG